MAFLYKSAQTLYTIFNIDPIVQLWKVETFLFAMQIFITSSLVLNWCFHIHFQYVNSIVTATANMIVILKDSDIVFISTMNDQNI